MFNDKRKSHRRPMRYTAWVAQKNKPMQGCVVADISETGARLKIEGGEAIPDDFVLVLSRRGETRRKCTVVWRGENHIGVEFSNSRAVKPNAKAFA